jgi:hypothetical protein
MRSYTIEQLVLGTATDDYENLEQLYRSLCLDFSAENYDASNEQCFYWRAGVDAPPLSELADAVRKLVTRGLLEGRWDDGRPIAPDDDPSFVWQGWFRTSNAGRSEIAEKNVSRPI